MFVYTYLCAPILFYGAANRVSKCQIQTQPIYMFRYFWANKSRKSEKLGDPVVEKANKIVLAEEGQKRREGD